MKIAAIVLFALLLAFAAQAQDTTTPTVTFPSVPMPAGIAVFGAFNQLGSPRFTAGFSGIYPVVGSLGLYGTTTAEIYPKSSVDPNTGKNFYAVSASFRQGLHKDILHTGRFAFLLGGDVGPGFSQNQPSGINVDLSSSFVATTVYQINPIFSAVVPIRMLYIGGIGWNPVIQAGFIINLKNLPKAKP